VVGVRWLSDGQTNGIKIIPFVCLSQVRVAGGLSDGQTNGIGVKIIHSSVCRSCVWLATWRRIQHYQMFDGQMDIEMGGKKLARNPIHNPQTS
jgi:hypothetical protein